MAGRIPREFIDDLLARVDIVDVIDARVPLKKAGANYKACCPFHGEKTPSFTVSPSKQFYHCFGCGAHGTAVGFLMEYDRLEFPDAIEELAKSLGVEVPREESNWEGQQRRQSADLYDLMKSASDHYQLELKKYPPAIEYLKQRGLTGDTAKDYGIGYAPAGWDFIMQRLGKSEEHKAKLEAAGMLIRNDKGRVYDRFRERIMFPIRDQRGKTIAFGGRVMGQGEPKYLNSPETPIFHKGRELYGLFEAKRFCKKLETILVVEGYMDVVMLAQHGIHNAVATLGTACTEEHTQRLFRAVDRVVFCFDGDRAGRDAAWRALNNSLPALQDGKQIQFLFLPDGEDPDSMVQQEGKEQFLNRVESAAPLSRYLIEHLANQADTNSIDGLARYAELAKPLLANIKAETFARLLKTELARAVGTSAEQLFGNAPLAPPSRTPAAPQRQPQGKAWHQVEMNTTRLLIAALIARPNLATTVSEPELKELQELQEKGSAFLLQLIQLLRASPTMAPAALLEHYRDTPYADGLMKLAAYEFQTDEEGNDRIAEEFQDALGNLLRRVRKKRRMQLFAKPPALLTEEERAFLKNFKD